MLCNLFRQNTYSAQTARKTAVFYLSGLHCTSCSLNIDGTLEELGGVIAADTSYARSQTKVEYNSESTTLDTLKQAIEQLGYTVTKIEE